MKTGKRTKLFWPCQTRQCTQLHHQPAPWLHPPWWIHGCWGLLTQRLLNQLHCCPYQMYKPEGKQQDLVHMQADERKKYGCNNLHSLQIKQRTYGRVVWTPTPIGEHLSTNFSSWDLAVPGSPSISRLMSPLRVRPSGSLKGQGFRNVTQK